MGQELQLMFTSTIRMGKKCYLSDFNRGMIVGARWAGLSISVAAGIFMHKTQYGVKNKKDPVSSSSMGQNMLLMSEVSGEGPD